MTDTWRYRCPEGHTSWERRVAYDTDWKQEAQAEYYCEHCGPFDELVDIKAQP